MKIGDKVRVARAPERIGTVREVLTTSTGDEFALVSFTLETWPVSALEVIE